MQFSDRLQTSIDRHKSFIVAGLDPVLETFPDIILQTAASDSANNEDAVYRAITEFYSLALESIAGSVAAVKPNIAFYEQYGIAGLRALLSICDIARSHELPIIIDAKRGDIGSTAEAYSRTFLGNAKFRGKTVSAFQADALTVNPYLGFDTLEPFLKDCIESEKGLFVLVKTSNPGSGAIMDASREGQTVSELVANWVAKSGEQLIGACGYSSIGAVVGATFPGEAQALRKLMPNSFFLIPGMGAQGGTAKDAVAGFSPKKGGGIINISRGLFSAFSSRDLVPDQIRSELKSKLSTFNSEITASLQ